MLEAIEEKFGFRYPEIYLRLDKDNMLDWGAQGPDWYAEVYPKLREKPPFLLFVGEFTIIQKEDLVKEVEKVARRVGDRCKLIPFGRDGVGNLYVMNYAADGVLDSVGIFNRDGSLVKLAKTLEDFIFRQLLGAGVQINPEDIEDEVEYNRDLFAMLDSHKPYLNPGRFSTLKSVYEKEIKEEDDEFGKISIDEYYELLQKEIYFSEINKKVMI